MSKITVRDLGVMAYDEAWELQHTLFDAMVSAKKEHRETGDECILIVEHPPVITLGKHAKAANLLLSDEELAKRGVECRRIERGGDITFHGPGQIVMYPILDLERHGLGVKNYVNLLEEAVIRTIAKYGIIGERVDGASGVWIGKDTARERKICALGVKCSRFCTMHGLALNVNTDLRGFSMINPCGFIDKGVTSMSVETGRDLDIAKVKSELSSEFLKLLGENTKTAWKNRN
ncbi:MAG: lipoyl(octanoyl) transferase LipB [Muribaculaceae bacterium]|nr:lipoyl(octanoyl) transferase LipB [Muribaculaceae bacterium]